MQIHSLLLSLLGSVSLAGTSTQPSSIDFQRCQEIRAHISQTIEVLKQDLTDYKQKMELLRRSFAEGRCKFERQTCELALKAGQAAIDDFSAKINALEQDLDRKCSPILTPPTILSSQPQGMTPLTPYFAYPSPAEIPSNLCFLESTPSLPSNGR